MAEYLILHGGINEIEEQINIQADNGWRVEMFFEYGQGTGVAYPQFVCLMVRVS